MEDRFKNWKTPKLDKDGWSAYGWRCQYPDGFLIGDKVDFVNFQCRGCFKVFWIKERVCRSYETKKL